MGLSEAFRRVFEDRLGTFYLSCLVTAFVHDDGILAIHLILKLSRISNLTQSFIQLRFRVRVRFRIRVGVRVRARVRARARVRVRVGFGLGLGQG